MIMKFLTIISFILFSFNAHAIDISKRISENISGYISNIIPGEGTTEVSVNLRENYKPDFSILGVRELKKNDNGNYFTQFSLTKSEQNNDERYTGNLGFGKRMLSDDKTLMTGINAFIDYDDEGNGRSSVGLEAKNAVLQLTSNYYKGFEDGNADEKVLDGYDLQLTSQIPYLHWANAFVNSYKWEGENRANIEGRKYGSELLLTPNLSLELAYDDKDLTALQDEYYVKIQFVYPPKQGPTALNGASQSMWKEEKDMSDQLLTKVKRQNKIMVEFDGVATISRLD